MRAFERQPRESYKAFEAWQLFRDMGPTRSYEAVAQRLRKSSTLIRRWARKWDWPGRMQALDDYLEMVRLEAIEQHERSHAADLAVRQQHLEETIFANAEKAARLTARILDRLAESPMLDLSSPTLDAGRLHRIALSPGKAAEYAALENIDMSELSDRQLERIANGEDPRIVLAEPDDPPGS